ncbi:MAG: hypothetical protein R6U46_09350 [Marinilabilia sp.]
MILNKVSPFRIKPVCIVFLLLTGFLLFPRNSLHGQHRKDELRLLARPMPDSILLRWAPANHQLWLSGNQHGYMVSKTCMVRDGELIETPETEILTEKPLKPAPLEEWEGIARDNDYAAIAAQAIWGEGFEVDAEGSGDDVLQIIDKASEQQSKFGFALLAADISPEVARLSGLWFTDKAVQPGEKYLYKVWPAQMPEGSSVDTAYFYSGMDEYRSLSKPANLKAEPGDKMVSLTWERAFQEEAFTGFWIERSSDGGESFEKLNESLLVNTTPPGRDESRFHHYIDSVPANDRDYAYRVIGVSPFGEKSAPSKVVTVKGEKGIKSAPRIISAGTSPSGVELEWSKESVDKVDGYHLYRSKKFKGGYTLLADSLPVKQQSFLDKSPLPTGYYRLQAYNKDGEGPLGTPKMVQTIDSIPPDPPVELEARVDSLGHVYLKWAENTEPDIDGYRVFRANATHEEFSQLTGSTVENNRYIDTINIKTLTKKVYYKILAVDQSQNWSDFSEVLEVDRPDVVPPATPLITSIEDGENWIELEWNRSPSADVKTQLVYRNKEDNREWVLIDKLPVEADAYKDSLATPETMYRYLVMAVDSAGNESKPGKVVAGKINSINVEPVKNIEAKYDKNQEAGVLIWEYDRDGYTFLIYKKDKEHPRLVHSTKSLKYVDRFISRNSTVSYSVVAKSPNGERSDFSEFVILNNKR